MVQVIEGPKLNIINSIKWLMSFHTTTYFSLVVNFFNRLNLRRTYTQLSRRTTPNISSIILSRVLLAIWAGITHILLTLCHIKQQLGKTMPQHITSPQQPIQLSSWILNLRIINNSNISEVRQNSPIKAYNWREIKMLIRWTSLISSNNIIECVLKCLKLFLIII